MARKLYYKILDDGKNTMSDIQWDEILRLQHWYNSEFVWTAGRLAFKMYAVFPNTDSMTANEDDLWEQIRARQVVLRNDGRSENEIIRDLAAEGLVIAKKGGYFDGCLASGFTRVAGNEFDAYLVCEFLLKASMVAPDTVIIVCDEGEFIKPRNIRIQRGRVILSQPEKSSASYYQLMVSNRHVFAIVDTAKYDHFPKYQTTIADFNDLPADEQHIILKDWNWLGFENNYDINGDDIQGFDLNKKVVSFSIDFLEPQDFP